MKTKHFSILLGCIIFAQLAGFIGSLFTTPALNVWYSELAKPEWNPPSWVFGPVWTGLFLLMGISLYVIIRHRRRLLIERKDFQPAMIAFVIQWLLNIGWSFCFFFLKRPEWALVDIALLIIAIIATIMLFYRINRGAAYLLLPYLVWVLFATYLNLTIVQLN